MLKFEFEDPTETRCACCGKPTVKLTRFVYQDDVPFAAYYVAFTPSHAEKRLDGIIGLGKWGSAKPGAQSRAAFVFQIWPGFDDLQAGLLDAEDSPWHGVTELGEILDREDALEHEWIDDTFLVIKSMVLEDQAIIDYFETNPTYN
jgi:hypothetical protein